MPGVVAIVGRPNVGKSALFNRIIGKRVAIVHDEPGVTRDRISGQAEFRGRPFTVIDTGGIGLVAGEKVQDVIINATIEQVGLAIESADVIVLVVNVQEGLVPLDREVAQRLRKSRKPVIVAVNKVDNFRFEAGTVDFASLGFEQILPLTAIHGMGIESLMETMVKLLPFEAEKISEPSSIHPEDEKQDDASASDKPLEEAPLKIAVVGRPNVGKSSLVNALTSSERLIVTPLPGTTRDSVDVPFEVETEGHRERFVLIDTAGIRKERRIDNSVEFFSLKRTEDSIARCDLVIFMLDAESGILEQDKKIADKIVMERKACVVVINKWDLVQEEVTEVRKEEVERRHRKTTHREGAKKRMTTLSEFAGWVQSQLFFLDYAPVIFTSATSGFHLERLLEAIRYVAGQLQQKIPTALLNRALNDAVERRQPVSSAGHRLKFFYATQVRQAPPTFLLFVNRFDLFSDAYRKYLSGELRKAFGFEGCPLVLVARARPKTIEPKRRFQKDRAEGGTGRRKIKHS